MASIDDDSGVDMSVVDQTLERRVCLVEASNRPDADSKELLPTDSCRRDGGFGEICETFPKALCILEKGECSCLHVKICGLGIHASAPLPAGGLGTSGDGGHDDPAGGGR